MERLKRARLLLARRGHNELAELLKACSLEITDTFADGPRAVIRAPVDAYERIRNIEDPDWEALVNTLREVRDKGELDVAVLKFELEPQSLVGGALSDADLLEELEAEHRMMENVACTGHGPRIKDANDEYKRRRDILKLALRTRGIPDPNPHADLWAWFSRWKAGDLPSYQSRRDYLANLFAPAFEHLKQLIAGERAEVFIEPTGWTRVDRAASEMRVRLHSATAEEQYQAVGLLCREALISVAQVVFEPAKHKTADGVAPSATDGKRMLEAYIGVELGGGANEIARKHAKAALDLANALQHQRTADFRSAALCAEATASVINIVSILAGRRDPPA